MRPRPVLWALPAALALAITHVCIQRRQPAPYMDELYHVPQAGHFCASLRTRTFPPYLPELTTPPGAYVLPALLSPLFGCGAGALRLHAALAALSCVPLLAAVAHALRGGRGPLLGDARAWRAAAVVATHPPLLFAGALFYTDAPAAALLLACWALALRGAHAAAALAGLLAAAARQTGFVWHVALALHAAAVAGRRRGSGGGGGGGAALALAPHAAAWACVLGLFAANGFSVAVGHRAHHAAAAHWAMAGYFGAYVGLFAAPALAVLGAPRALALLTARAGPSAGAVAAAGAAALVAAARKSGAAAHPFALADNRHFTFYLYRRLLRPYPVARDAVAAAGAAALALLLAPAALRLSCAAAGKRAPKGAAGKMGGGVAAAAAGELAAQAGMILATFASVVPTPLLEPRYFIPGYVVCMTLFLSSESVRLSNRTAALCVAFNLLLHFAMVYVFAERPFARAPDAHMPHDLSPGRFMY